MDKYLILNIKYFEKEKKIISIYMNLKEQKKINNKITYKQILKILYEKLNLDDTIIEEIKLLDEKNLIYNNMDENFEIKIKDLKEKNLNLLIIKNDNKLNKISENDINEIIKIIKYEMNEKFDNLNKDTYNLRFIIALILKNTNFFQNKGILEYLEKFINNCKMEDDDIINFLNISKNEISESTKNDKKKSVEHFSSMSSSFNNLNLNLIKVQSEVINKKNTLLDPQMIDLLKQATNKAFDQINLENKKKEFKLKKGIDFQIIFSNPLIRKVTRNSKLNLKIGELNYNLVDFNSKCKNIIKILEKSNLDLNVSINSGNFEKFIKKIKKNPKILHIICYGEICEEEYSLQLEGDEGQLYSLSFNELKEILKNNQLEIKLIFLNSLHSQKIGELFLESGVECVICINSLNIGDEYVQLFSEKFYNDLFSNTISDSYHNAKSLMEIDHKINNSLNCCCFHTHKPNCIWFQTKIEHETHIPLCDCPQKNKYIHEIDCEWSEDFLLSYSTDDIEYDLENNVICCCSPEIPHNEDLRLKLLFKNNDENLGKKKLFDNIKGKINYLNFRNIRFGEVNAKGQNINIYNLYNLVKNKRVVICKGDKGSGKTYMIKYWVNYLEERKNFKKIIYLYQEEVNKIDSLLLEILNELKIKIIINNQNYISKLLKKKFRFTKILIVINNLKDNLESVYKFLNLFLNETSIHFLISTNSNQNFKNESIDIEVYKMKAMTYNMAECLLFENLPNISHNDWNEIKNILIKKHKFPKEILKLAKLIEENYKNNISINKIQYLLDKENNSIINKENKDNNLISHEYYNQSVLTFFNLENFNINLKNKEIETLLFFLIFLPDNLILNIHLNIINKFWFEFNIFEMMGFIKEIPTKFNNLEEYLENLNSSFDKKCTKKILKNNNFTIFSINSKYDNKEYFILKLSLDIKNKIFNLAFFKDYAYLDYYIKNFIYFVIEIISYLANYYKNNNLYFESIIELTCISEYGNWNLIKINNEKKIIENLNINQIKLLNKNTINNIKIFIQNLNSNCFIKYIEYLFNKNNKDDKEKIINNIKLIEDLLIKLITILKINKKYKKDIITLINIFIDLFWNLEKNDENLFYNLISKLYLIKLWYHYKILKKCDPKDKFDNNIEKLILKVKNYIENNNIIEDDKYIYLGEFFIIYLKYLKMNSNFDYPDELTIIINEIKKIKNTKILLSKLYLEIFRFCRKKIKISDEFKSIIIEYIENLDNFVNLKIKIYGMYYLIKYFISNPEKIKNYIEDFKKINDKINNNKLLKNIIINEIK